MLEPVLSRAKAAAGKIVVVTGAGVSAASGIPTFRGKEGYWTVGSTAYHPQELATQSAFRRMPRDVWGWYLYRRAVCRGARPNAGHLALVAIEQALDDRFVLITQNVDGLHARAGNSAARMYEVHGNIDYARCADHCTTDRDPLDDDVVLTDRGATIDDALWARLRCPRCGALARPHVLWFDECYDEPLFRIDSSLAAAADAALVITVGTTAMTTLPVRVVEVAIAHGAGLVDINPEPNPFSSLTDRIEYGAWISDSADRALPELAAALRTSEDSA